MLDDMKMKLFSLLAFLVLAFTGGAQTNLLTGSVANYGLAPQTGIACTLTLVSPNPRTVNGVFIRRDPVVATSGTNGLFYFTNVIWGNYTLAFAGRVDTVFRLAVLTNTVGEVPLASLATSATVAMPNPATNYYTMSQVDALVAGAGGGGGAAWTNAHDSVVLIAGDNGVSTGAVESVLAGYKAGSWASNATSDVFIGTGAGRYAADAAGSTFIGAYAGRNATNNTDSVFIGKYAGESVVRPSTLIISGTGADVGTNALLYGEFDNGLLRVNGNLNVTGTATGPDATTTNGFVTLQQLASSIGSTHTMWASTNTGRLAGYYNALMEPPTHPAVTISAENVTNGMVLGQWVSDTNMASTIRAGIGSITSRQRITTTAGNHSLSVIPVFYIRHADETETAIDSAQTVTLTDTLTDYLTEFMISSNMVVSATDRMVVRWVAVAAGNTPTWEFECGSTIYGIVVNFPVVTAVQSGCLTNGDTRQISFAGGLWGTPVMVPGGDVVDIIKDGPGMQPLLQWSDVGGEWVIPAGIGLSVGSTITGNGAGITNIASEWFVLPSQYGATGNGTTDDTTALQAWINGASSSQKTAMLPPASGGYYKITAPLIVTNAHGLRMQGQGGIFHNPGTTPSACQIRQFTAGLPALIVTNAIGSTSPPDSIHITSVAFVANTYSSDTNSFGIGFVGGVDDSDNCSINYCLVSGFRRGIVNAGAAILTIQGTTLCYNGDGYYQGPYWANTSPVLNANYIGGSSITHNYTNAINVRNGRLTVESTDLVDTDTGIPATVKVLMTNCTVSLRNVNLEHKSDGPAYVALANAQLSVYGGLHQNFGTATTNTYLVAATNSGTILWDSPSVGMTTSAGDGAFAFVEVDTTPYAMFASRTYLKSRLIVPSSSRTYTNYSENFVVSHFPALTAEATSKIGLLQVNKTGMPEEATTVLTFGSQVAGTSVPLDLTQYYKDGQATMTNNNLVVKGALTANASGLTNFPSTIPRTNANNVFYGTNYFIGLTNPAAASTFGAALVVGTNTTGTPWLMVTNGVTYFKELRSAYPGNNIGIGSNAAQVVGAGTLNVAIGSSALSKNTSGNYNIAVGGSTLQSLTNGDHNVAVGYRSVYSAPNVTQTVAIGAYALETAQGSGIAIGYQAGRNSAGGNISIGTRVHMGTISTGNIGIGSQTALTTGSLNVGVGGMDSLKTGGENTSLGAHSLLYEVAGNRNTSIGAYSLANQTNGTGMVSVGYHSGRGTSGASDNGTSVADTNCTFIGTFSGRSSTIPNTTPLTNAIALGYNAKAIANNTCTIGGTGAGAVALVLNPMGVQPTNIVVGNTYIYSRTNSGVAELFAVGGDGVETQISPHADDAPPQLYDRAGGDMKEIIWRESNPYATNGMVSFINMRRMARLTELNTRAILYLGGNVTAATSNALVRLKNMTVAERQILMTENYPTYNARTGSNLQPLDWNATQNQLQATYDMQRENIDLQRTHLTQTNEVISAQIAAGDTNAVLVELPEPLPVKNVRQPKPAWMK